MRRAAALMALGIAGCAADAPPPSPRAGPAPTTLEGVYWRLEAFWGEDAEPGVSLSFDGDRLRGEAPCNRYFGGYVLDGAYLGVGAVAATRRACPRLEFEQRYLALLTEVKGYVIEDGALTLFDGDGAPLMRFGA